MGRVSDDQGVLIAVAQPRVTPGDVSGNVDRMSPMVKSAADNGAALVLFSECGITGYDLRGVGAKAAPGADDPPLAAVHRLATEHGIVIVAGYHERTAAAAYVTSAAFYPDGERVVQRKHRITEIETELGLSAGPAERTFFTVAGLRCAMLICADTGIDDIMPRLAEQGCDLVLVPTAGLGDAAKGYLTDDLKDEGRRRAYLAASATVCGVGDTPAKLLELDMARASVNQMGYEPALGYFHPGHSSIIDRTGQITALIPGSFLIDRLQPKMAIGSVHRRA